MFSHNDALEFYSEAALAYKLKVTNCNLVIIDDDISTEWMLPHVKYLRLSDVYTNSVYNNSLSLCNYQTLLESIGILIACSPKAICIYRQR